MLLLFVGSLDVCSTRSHPSFVTVTKAFTVAIARRTAVLACAAAAALLALANLRALVWHSGESTARAAAHRSAAKHSPEPTPPSQAADAPGVDLDARYPAEGAFWARVDASGRPRSAPPWIVALRHEMLAAAGGDAPRIPHHIHQTWKDANPPRVLFSPRWSRSLRELNDGWAYRLWTDDENRALIAERYPWLLPTYDAYESPIQRADVARYAIAHAHGGVYADLDTECFKPFAPLVRGSSLLLSYKLGANFSRGACNSIFASAPAQCAQRTQHAHTLNPR